jgi:quinol monooxygenase YgiN
MILEVAIVHAKEGSEAAFITAFPTGAQYIRAAKNCHSVSLRQCVERPNCFILHVEWDSVEDHNAFRASPDFAKWRAAVGPLFGTPAPVVEHYALVG